MYRLGIDSRLLHPADRRIRVLEIISYRLNDLGTRFGSGARQVLVAHPEDRRLGRELVHTRTCDRRPAAAAAAPAVVHELRIRSSGVVADELELPPQATNLLFLLLAENQLDQRLIVAEVAHHIVQTRAE